MPRRDKSDEGEDAMAAPDRPTANFMERNTEKLQQHVPRDDDDPDLVELERRLNEEVDDDFFEEPRKFNTLDRVIDVLGLQMMDDATVGTTTDDLQKNPAYRNLQEQQTVVEDAIEHMAVIHCADLNGSVIQVGKVARQFSDAVYKVRALRKQVHDIQDTLGASAGANPNEPSNQRASRPHNTAAMSLRELWLKKLECEATLSLLDKLDVIRAAPSRFDQMIQPPCRIATAVVTLSQALQTMFSDDVAQVQALHKIMEQLMLRKQKAEEIVWETLSDVIFLRNGNTMTLQDEKLRREATSTNKISSSHSVSSQSYRSNRLNHRQANKGKAFHGMLNPFYNDQMRYALEEDVDDDSVDSAESGASLFSVEEDDDHTVTSKGTTSASVRTYDARMLIPVPVIEADLDLETDERRCLEDATLSTMATKANSTLRRQRQLPRYADPVLALRILVECLAHLKRLDDVERILNENLEKEIRQIVQREQARTFARLERKGRKATNVRALAKSENLIEFRRHLTGLLSAFGCIMLRLSHLAEILRFRISADRELMKTFESPSSVLRNLISGANDTMQREIKDFLKACFYESEQPKESIESQVKGARGYESGLFSLGIVEASHEEGEKRISAATKNNVMEMSAGRFVASIMFPKVKCEPETRHALTFRRGLAHWSSELDSLKKELAAVTGEDTSSPSYKYGTEESAIAFLDDVIQKNLLPMLQEEAVNGTVQALERRDAFDPVLDRTVYAGPSSNDPKDVDMCIACQRMYDSTGPLFMALHRLPRGGDMYLPLVAVLEHVILTFISRIKQQVSTICNKKTAWNVLISELKGQAFSSIIEGRKPFQALLRAYSDGDSIDTLTGEQTPKHSGISPLAPPVSDTSSHNSTHLDGIVPVEDVSEDVDGEERIFEMEVKFIEQYLDFSDDKLMSTIAVCSDEELMRASCLSHSLLKLSMLLDDRLKVRTRNGFNKMLVSTRALREAIKTIKINGVKMAKFCRIDMMLQSITRLSKISKSSTIVASDAVRIPSSVNDLGEYLTGASDNLREAAGNAVTAYTFSSLEQYIPFCLMQTVRVVASGKGIVAKSPLTMNGIEALDRSGSVLYRDLKGATSFDNSLWDVELAAISFERSASFIAMMELEMEELVAYYSANKEDFSEKDFELMFNMNGPRRRGDVGRYHMLNRKR